MGNLVTNPLIFLIQTILGTYGFFVLLRFIFQLVQVDFYNPVSQFIVTVTAPVLRPLRTLIPNLDGLDIASLVLAWFLKVLELFLVLLLMGYFRLGVVVWAIPELVEMVFNIFIIAILIQVVMSWIFPGGAFNPVLILIEDLAEPVLRPARQLIPPFEGLDFSPMLATVALIFLRMLLVPILKALTGSPF